MEPSVNQDLPSRFLKDVINPWLLGADPEFAVLTPPDQVVPNAGQHAVNTTKAAGGIGSDHNGRVWELRPSPSPSAYVVTTNLCKLLRQAEMSKVEGFKWKSGALGGRKNAAHFTQGFTAGPQPTTLQGWIQFYSNPIYGLGGNQAVIDQMAQQAFTQQQQMAQVNAASDTLGGHVHFGIAAFNASQRKALNDVTLGLLDLEILPHKENDKRLSLTAHSNPQYGHITGGDAVRSCDGHVEYRCAPSWLDRPGQALAALTIYKLAGARPSSVTWPKSFALQASLLEWLEQLSGLDVDAWILSKYVAERGFGSIQADPASDFKPRWRRDQLL